TDSMNNMIHAAVELQSLDISYRRIFVIGIIEVFQHLRDKNELLGRIETRQILRSTIKMLGDKEKEDVEREEF
ncbi:unnamed protein product, partial [marine sediment metagenome]